MEADSMTLPLRRGVPRLRSVGADGLAILVSLIALSTGSASVGAEDLPDKVVLDFTATWCGPCQKMSPIVHQLEQQGYIIRKVDVDRQRKLAQSYGIRSIPTFVLVIDGREVDRITGMASEEQLRRLAERTIERPAPPARELPRDDLPFPGNARTASATQDVELPFAVSPDEAPDFSAPSTAAPSQPSGLFPKPKFPSLFPKRKVASVAERDSRPLPTDVRSQTPDAGGDLSTEDRLLAVTARLIVSDATGSNFGSGTIIDSRPGYRSTSSPHRGGPRRTSGDSSTRISKGMLAW
jgi:thioredoxin